MTTQAQRFNALLLLSGLIFTAIGCGGSGHDRTEVTGKLTLDGKPMPSGLTIKFTPDDGRPASLGATTPESTYTVYGEPGKIGLHPGTYTVSVELPFADEPGPYTGPPELAKIKIPSAYQTGKSSLTFSVPDDGTTFDIEMTSK